MTATVAYAEFFAAVTGFAPFPYQGVLGDAPLPEVLTAPTGAGKTEAVIVPWLHAHAEGRPATTRLVYVLPMRTLVRQTADRVRRMLERGELTGIAVHETLGGAVDDGWVGDPSRPAVIVGTTDLLVSRMLLRGYASAPGRWPMQFALLHNDATWVLDEVQLFGAALPTTRQLQSFRERYGAFGATPAVWMSATVPAGRLATVDRPTPEPHRVLGLSDADVAHARLGARWRARKIRTLLEGPVNAESVLGVHAAALERHGPAALTLVVVNTVRAAQDLHARLARQNRDGTALLLLHSRYRPPDRDRQAARLDELGADGGIVVATQVVEAGVDLDARALVTELCPWPSLVQRLGRLHRRGDPGVDACDALVHLPAEDDLKKLHGAPYPLADLTACRRLLRLDALADLSPSSLAAVDPPPTEEDAAVLRSRDLEQLFDSTASLEGQHTGVSRFVRDVDEVDVRLYWRAGEAPAPGEPSPRHEELCPVPLGAARAYAAKNAVWRRSPVDATWSRVRDRELSPGMELRADADAGGYESDRGWTGTGRTTVPPVPVPARAADDTVQGDVEAHAVAPPTLTQHGADARGQAERLLVELVHLGVPPEASGAVADAAWLHDLGKAHRVFQEAIRRLNPDLPDVPMAKSGTVGRVTYPDRPHFRHEVASVLAIAAALDAGDFRLAEPDLVCYLVGAHHGKARMSPPLWRGERPRDVLVVAGLCEGDELPQVAIDGHTRIGPAKVGDLAAWSSAEGGRWSTQARAQLRRWGPFRLAYLEALVRAADWHASAHPGSGAP